MYKVRFHLGRGDHYMHWQIRGPGGYEAYFNPDEFVLNMFDCQLISNERIAKRVNASGKKDVCGWIKTAWVNCDPAPRTECDWFDNLPRVWYNPIVDTDWHMQNIDSPVTGWKFRHLATKGKRVYSCKL